MKKTKEIETQFAVLAEENQGIIHKVCSMYCSREADRKDLFQDILVQWWRAFPSFKGDAKFSTWGYRVAINTAISNFRKEKRRLDYQSLSLEVLQIPDLPSGNSGMEEQKDLLYRAINQLSKVEKAIMMLYLEDYNYEEIATIIGITKTNVGVKINRIKGKLKNILVK